MMLRRGGRVLVLIVSVVAFLCVDDVSAQSRLLASDPDLRDELKAIQRQLTDLRVAVGELAGRQDSTVRLIDVTNKRIDGLQSMMTWALGFLTMIALAAISGAVSLNTLKLELRHVTKDVAALQTDVAALKTDVGALKTDVAALKTDVAALKTDVAALKTDVAALKTDVAALKTDVAVLTTESAGRDGLLKNLYERLGERYPRPGEAT